jgi:hypothetical protein
LKTGLAKEEADLIVVAGVNFAAVLGQNSDP